MMEQREKLIDIMAGSPVTSIVSYESTRELADHILANGVVVPVRCKDCKHCYVNRDGNVSFNECELNHNHVQDDDWFCADGERKGGEEVEHEAD